MFCVDDSCLFVGMPSSVEEIENGLWEDAFASMPDDEYRKLQRVRKMYKGKQYWLDNCGDDEDHSAEWYCTRCDQEECGKRIAARNYSLR